MISLCKLLITRVTVNIGGASTLPIFTYGKLYITKRKVRVNHITPRELTYNTNLLFCPEKSNFLGDPRFHNTTCCTKYRAGAMRMRNSVRTSTVHWVSSSPAQKSRGEGHLQQAEMAGDGALIGAIDQGTSSSRFLVRVWLIVLVATLPWWSP